MKLHVCFTLSLGTFLLHHWESAYLEATGMYGPAHNLDRGTCPGTNGSTLTLKRSHLSHSNTQPHVATHIFYTCFSCERVCYNGHYKILDIHIAIWHCTVIVMRLFLHGIW